MIYMRDRGTRKKNEGPELAKRLILDEIKQKISQGMVSNKKSPSQDKQPAQGENTKHADQRPRFQIFKKDLQRKAVDVFPDQKMCESIVIESHQKMFHSDEVSLKAKVFSVQKCFDIQVVNMLGSKLKLEAFVKVIQDQNAELKQKIQHLSERLQRQSKQIMKDNEVRNKELQANYQKLLDKNKEYQNRITKYHRCFEEGKNTLLNASMKLIEAKNTLGIMLNSQQQREKQEEYSFCLEKAEKMISVYSHFIQEESNAKPKEGVIIQQLTSMVKYQERTIEKLAENRQKDKEIYRQNVLLRYEINRLSNHNEELLGLLAEAEREPKVYEYQSAPKKTINYNYHEQLSSFCQTDPLQSTPVDQLIEIKTPDEGLSKIAECSQYESLDLWKQEVSEKESRIKNLEIEKQYLSDQLISIQKDFQDLQKQFKRVNEEKDQALDQIKVIKEERERLERELQISQQQENVMNDQISLLKEKIKHLEAKGEQIKGSQPVVSRYLDETQSGETVTVENILKFFKKHNLKRYHQALMDLISRYQQRISQLNNSFKNQKEMKEKLLSYSRGLYSMVTSSCSLSLQNIVLQISKYQEIISGLHENKIDILLRQVKCFSIGIDTTEYENICSQLEDYVYHLKTRLPTLSEEYFEDGSSVADSCVGEMSPIMI